MPAWLTSSTLIQEVQRSAMIPTNQSTFTEDDFLAFANQEMKIGLVPAIMQYHQEYYVRDTAPVPIIRNQTNYSIPYRALGGKLREVYYLDTNSNLRTMSRISPDDRPYYQQSSFQYTFIPFFIQGDEIVLIQNYHGNPVGNLVFSFFMRPNNLVDESRVATIENITTTNQTGNITTISTGSPTVNITAPNHGLATGNIITITQSNSNPLVNGIYPVTVIDSNTFSINATVTTAGTTGFWQYSTTSYQVDQIPTGFTVSTKYDLLQTNPGHKTYNYDVVPIALDPINKIITFNTVDTLPATYGPNVANGPIVGDYIAFSGECIIPQAPTELHDILAQRVVMRCLQALGDQAGYAQAQARLQEMEKTAGILIDNRVEGSPVKINNIRGLLRTSKITRRWWL